MVSYLLVLFFIAHKKENLPPSVFRCIMTRMREKYDDFYHGRNDYARENAFR
jgi:hypothetical protein